MTHLDTNKMNQFDKNQLRAEIERVRSLIVDSGVFSGFGKEKPEAIRRELLKNEAGKIKEYKLGNCWEYSVLTAQELLNQQVKQRVDIYQIKNGDHIFVVLDRDSQSDELDYTTWGENAVVCDAWAGRVYQAKDMPQLLGAYQEWFFDDRDESSQMVANFNPHYHQLRLVLSFAADEPAFTNLLQKSI